MVILTDCSKVRKAGQGLLPLAGSSKDKKRLLADQNESGYQESLTVRTPS